MARSRRVVKGNSKGWRKSYQARRTALIGGTSLLIALVLVLTCTSFFKEGVSKQVRHGAHAAEVEMTLNGEAAGLKGSPPEDKDKSPSHLLLKTFPTIKYGTAWKEERTADLVYKAVKAGFRHIDTACQPRHYNEPLVGEGWTSAARDLGLQRSDFWLQTKFTSPDGQDENRTPYDRNAPRDGQVLQSFQNSLENLRVEYIDSLVMHGPENNWDDNLLVWRTMESLVDSGKVGQIGISNFYDADAVEYLYEQARIKPAVVQNRFYGDSGYDVDIRNFCLDHGMEYQSFWTLGANYHAIHHDDWMAMASKKGLTPETLMYTFVMAIGITPLDGSTNEEHMAEDMALLKRIRSGEKILNEEEIELCAELLGIPGESESEEMKSEENDSEEYDSKEV